MTLPAGFEDLKTRDDVVDALAELRAQRPGIRRAVIKLNDSFSGEGNAVVHLSRAEPTAAALPGAVDERRSCPVPTETPDRYFEKFWRMGGIVEEFIEADEKTSPSAQFRTSPHGEVLRISTHDQILGGESGQIYLGCRFPGGRANIAQQIREAGRRVGEVLAEHGVVSRYGVDFLAWRNDPREPWRITALEINLRVARHDAPVPRAADSSPAASSTPRRGQFLSLSGRPKFYRATDNLRSERYRGILPEDLFDIVTMNGLHYSHRTESGVLFHLIGAVSEFGKLGLTVIANSPEEVDVLYNHMLGVLDRETSMGRARGEST